MLFSNHSGSVVSAALARGSNLRMGKQEIEEVASAVWWADLSLACPPVSYRLVTELKP
jgi:hypothetical protein